MTTETDWADKIGKPAYDSIADMVAALECDYDRLEELRDEKTTWIENDGGDEDEQNRTEADWLKEFPDDAEELKELEEAAGESKSREDAETRIQEDPLSVEVRSGWVSPGTEASADLWAEFCILLSTGGPAVRIIGDLDANGEPRSPRLEVQDWFKPWTEYIPAAHSVLLEYCRQFVYVS